MSFFVDKICDQVSDGVLDACLAEDPYSKVACGKIAYFNILLKTSHSHIYLSVTRFYNAESATKTGMIMAFGEITTKAHPNYQKVVRDVVEKIGFDDSSKGARSTLFTLNCIKI